MATNTTWPPNPSSRKILTIKDIEDTIDLIYSWAEKPEPKFFGIEETPRRLVFDEEEESDA